MTAMAPVGRDVFAVARMRRLALVAEYLRTRPHREIEAAGAAARAMTDAQLAAAILAAGSGRRW